MTSNASFYQRTLLNTPPLFNGDVFELWKDRFKILIQSFDLEFWETIVNGLFIPVHCINGEVVEKPNFL